MDTPEFPDGEHPFRLVAAPARHFLNTTFNNTPTSRRLERAPRALLHPETMKALGLREGDLVRIRNRRGAVTVRAAACEGQHPRTVVVESIWPNDAFPEGIGINVLVGADPAPPAGGAAFHDTKVALEPVREAAKVRADTAACV
ncbi:hypothetical protein HRbin39_01598 [bacterium HR39]|nr:hypothetical protein HRbin39_01598 [bacterium HR39]